MGPEFSGAENQPEQEKAKLAEALLSYESEKRGPLPVKDQMESFLPKVITEQDIKGLGRKESTAYQLLAKYYPIEEDRTTLAKALYEKFHDEDWTVAYESAAEDYEKSQQHDFKFEQLRREQEVGLTVAEILEAINKDALTASEEQAQQARVAQESKELTAFRDKIAETRQHLIENMIPVVMDVFKKATMEIKTRDGVPYTLYEYGATVIPHLLHKMHQNPGNIEQRESTEKATELFFKRINEVFSRGQKMVLEKAMSNEITYVIEEFEMLKASQLEHELSDEELNNLAKLEQRKRNLAILFNLIRTSETFRRDVSSS